QQQAEIKIVVFLTPAPILVREAMHRERLLLANRDRAGKVVRRVLPFASAVEHGVDETKRLRRTSVVSDDRYCVDVVETVVIGKFRGVSHSGIEQSATVEQGAYFLLDDQDSMRDVLLLQPCPQLRQENAEMLRTIPIGNDDSQSSILIERQRARDPSRQQAARHRGNELPVRDADGRIAVGDPEIM